MVVFSSTSVRHTLHGPLHRQGAALLLVVAAGWAALGMLCSISWLGAWGYVFTLLHHAAGLFAACSRLAVHGHSWQVFH
jgi:hypothetical protein